MAAEYMVLNPRRRRGRRRRARRARASAPRRRRRRNPGLYMMNPRRRRGRRRARRNPRALFGGIGGRAFKFFGMDVGQAFWIAGGAIGNGVVSGMVAPMIPVPQLQSGPGRVALKAVASLLTGTVAGMLFGRKAGELIGVGGLVGVAIDVYKMVPGVPSLGDYNEVLEDYVTEVPALSGVGEAVPMAEELSALPGRSRITHLAPWQQ